MGISNIALAEYLHKEGALLTLRDRRPPSPATNAHLQALSQRCIWGEEYLSELSGEYIFRAPSIRPDITEFLRATASGSRLGSEWELFFHRAPCDIFAVTGSDGKTTTVTLTEKILSLSQPHRQIIAAGNIGIPLISLLDDTTINDIIIAELSSFQLMTFDTSPKVSAITNITPNHLDYHKDMDEYVRSKLKIIGTETHRTVIHTERIPKEFHTHSQNNNNLITCGFSDTDTIYCHSNKIFDHNLAVLNTESIKLKGNHNIENYMTAIGICGDLSTVDAINEVAEAFDGVAHRAQLVCNRNGIKYYDSSIDSTPSRTTATLQSLTTPITVICGGYDKNLTYEILADALNKNAYAVIVTGSSAPKILDAIYRLPSRNFLCFHEKDFEKAVIKAARITPQGGSVVLSPACASFDRFKDYKERGLFFQRIVDSFTE